MTIAKQIFDECRQKLRELNYDPGNVSFEFIETGTAYAYVKTIGHEKYIIQLSLKFDLEKESHREVLRSTIYHELCHCLTLNIGFRSHFFV